MRLMTSWVAGSSHAVSMKEGDDRVLTRIVGILQRGPSARAAWGRKIPMWDGLMGEADAYWRAHLDHTA